jgi:translocation protein SEC63
LFGRTISLTATFQGQFFPFFVLTITGLVTLPLTYTLIRPASAVKKDIPGIKTDYKHKDAEIVESLRRAEKKQHRRVKRALVVLAGWAIMGAMVYLIIVTQRIVPQIWNPYDILGISDVRRVTLSCALCFRCRQANEDSFL